MNIDLARRMIRTAFESGALLQDLLLSLKEDCSPTEYRGLARSIAIAIDHTNIALMQTALNVHPELKSEVEKSIEQTGRYRL